MTPEQYRALAGDWQQQLHHAAMTQSEKDKRERTVAALRSAADQLEAVQAELANMKRTFTTFGLNASTPDTDSPA